MGWCLPQIPLKCKGGASGKELACQCRRHKAHRFSLWVGKILWRRKWQSTPVFLSGEFHGQGSLVGYRPWGHKESNSLNMHVQILFSWVPKSVWMVTAAMKLKDACSCPWKETNNKPRQYIKKQRHHFAEKVCIVKATVFSSSHVQMAVRVGL